MKGKKVTTEDLARMVKGGFDGVDKKFEAVGKRFDAVDKRFDKVEARLENLESGQDEIILRIS